VSHRGQVNYTEDEARDGIDLQLGDATPSSTVQSTPPPALPAASPPTPSAKALTPSDGYVYIVTRSGRTYCQITTFEVDCQAPFTNTPFVNGMRANGVRFTADGKVEWVSGDLGDIPVVGIDYGTYRALSWTIVATQAGTTFTHSNGHSIFVSLDNVATS
jgi:hypothetical protein